MKVYNRFLPLNSPSTIKLVEIISKQGGIARIVGGAVRDSLIGSKISDVDIATNLTPGQVIDLLTKNYIKVIPTGIQYGTVTAIINNQPIEITTLRKDIKCFGRKAKVDFTDSFEEDAQRRDFTINALSYCPLDHKIYDYFNGIDDLNSKKVIFIGIPLERIREDYLRILRFFRFSLRFSKEIDKKGLEACIEEKEKLSLLSKERVKSEMDLIFNNMLHMDVVEIMAQSGILEILYPKTYYNKKLHQEIASIAKNYNIASIYLLFYASIFKESNITNTRQLIDLKFSRQEAIIILELLEFFSLDSEQLNTRLGQFYIEKREYEIYFIFAMAISDQATSIKQKLLQYQKLIKKPVFPISGNDLMNLGFYGQEIKRNMDYLKTLWIQSDFILSKNQLIKLIQND
ncbi:MAG TPA: CCA tRNA nucleotidyltransferase [Candidatus Megaira endosymbiont of Nemacystus decipiens]|nr:CCA tRNA nucleotidyltransferase [Candidatus Megaera endosymbiont of Nemacystus decipiens]